MKLFVVFTQRTLKATRSLGTKKTYYYIIKDGIDVLKFSVLEEGKQKHGPTIMVKESQYANSSRTMDVLFPC